MIGSNQAIGRNGRNFNFNNVDAVGGGANPGKPLEKPLQTG
jgi:hypothetical protein